MPDPPGFCLFVANDHSFNVSFPQVWSTQNFRDLSRPKSKSESTKLQNHSTKLDFESTKLNKHGRKVWNVPHFCENGFYQIVRELFLRELPQNRTMWHVPQFPKIQKITQLVRGRFCVTNSSIDLRPSSPERRIRRLNMELSDAGNSRNRPSSHSIFQRAERSS